MNKNLQELTDRIYREGIVKANEEGDAILDKSKNQARELISEAEKKAATIIEKAEKRAREIRVTNESEMRLASRQAISALKQRIVDLIIAHVIEGPLEQAFDDPTFVQGILSKMIDHWIGEGGEHDDIRVILPDEDRAQLREFFNKRGAAGLEKGLEVEYTGLMKDGFVIGPQDGRYKISFSSEDFENYFKTFMRPRLLKLLYGEDE